MQRFFLTGLLALLAIMLASPAAFAHGKDANTAYYDKTSSVSSTDCEACHYSYDFRLPGPHGGYTDGTDKCKVCHNLHAQGAGPGQGADNAALLMGSTLTAACQFCHNLTASNYSPYNKNGSMTAAASHRVVGIDFDGLRSDIHIGSLNIPGGALDGGNGTLNVSDQGKLSGASFTCDSCHTPHGVNTVARYLGESVTYVDPKNSRINLTNRLLKSKPNASSEPITTYGSAWCAACHQGRAGNPGGHYNHPVDMNKPAYQFLDLAAKNGSPLTDAQKQAVIGRGYVTFGIYGDVDRDPRTNEQYAMAAINELTGKAPANGNVGLNPNGPTCQQCHASSRDISNAFAGVVNGTVLTNNPKRGNFPHISDKAYLLIQDNNDTFCANCHKPSSLP